MDIPQPPQLSDEDKEALKFLERDFIQNFNQMRHYDAQIFDTFKFLFSCYIGLVGFSLGLYQFGVKENIDLRLPGMAALTIGLLLGVFMYAVVLRNRVYFVKSARYINEQRKLFLALRPLGFGNISDMYTNPSHPPYFQWRSTQFWFSLVIALFNSVLLGVLFYIKYDGFFCDSSYFIVGGPTLLFMGQVLWAKYYLTSRENKCAAQAVFGRKS